MDIKSFYKYLEHRGQSGYGAAILVKKQEETQYSLLIASQTVPAVFGSVNSFEFDLLNSPVTGKIKGKQSLDDKEVTDVLLHRDNVFRFEELKNKVLDFLYVTPDFVGWKFSGTLSFRPNDGSGDVLTGTYTITPMSADDTPILDCRSLCLETICFSEAIPDTAKSTDSVDLRCVQAVNSGFTPVYKWFKINANNTRGEATTLALSSGTTIASLSFATSVGLYGIEVSATNYAPWVTTIYIEKVGN